MQFSPKSGERALISLLHSFCTYIQNEHALWNGLLIRWIGIKGSEFVLNMQLPSVWAFIHSGGTRPLRSARNTIFLHPAVQDSIVLRCRCQQPEAFFHSAALSLQPRGLLSYFSLSLVLYVNWSVCVWRWNFPTPLLWPEVIQRIMDPKGQRCVWVGGWVGGVDTCQASVVLYQGWLSFVPRYMIQYDAIGYIMIWYDIIWTPKVWDIYDLYIHDFPHYHFTLLTPYTHLSRCSWVIFAPYCTLSPGSTSMI